MKTLAGRGIIFVTLSSVLYGIIPLLIKLTLESGMSVPCATLYRSLTMAGFAFAVIQMQREPLAATGRQMLQLVTFGTLGLGMTNILLGTSYLYINIGLATVCHFAYPIIVVLAMRMIFAEKLTKIKLLATVLMAAGLLQLAASSGVGSLKGIMIAILSGVAYGAYVISLDKAAFHAMPKMVIVFYASGLIVLMSTLQSLATHALRLPTSMGEMGLLLCSGVMSMAAMVLLAEGIKCLGAAKAAFINVLEPVTSVVVDFLYFGAIPTLPQSIGCVLILSSVVIISAEGRQENGR